MCPSACPGCIGGDGVSPLHRKLKCDKVDVEDPKEPFTDESSEGPDDDCAYEAHADPSNDSLSRKTCDATDDDR